MELGNSSTSFDNNKNQNNQYILGEKKMETNLKEIVDFYSVEMENAIELGYNIEESHDIAKDFVRTKFPETKEWGFDDKHLSGAIGNAKQKFIKQYQSKIESAKQKIIKKYKPTKTIKPEEMAEPIQMPANRRINYFQAYRQFCENGFLPAYLEPIIGLKKQNQIRSYKNFLEKEGYIFKEEVGGWSIDIESMAKKRAEQQAESEAKKKEATAKLEAEIRRLEIGRETLIAETDKVGHELDQKRAELKTLL